MCVSVDVTPQGDSRMDAHATGRQVAAGKCKARVSGVCVSKHTPGVQGSGLKVETGTTTENMPTSLYRPLNLSVRQS